LDQRAGHVPHDAIVKALRSLAELQAEAPDRVLMHVRHSRRCSDAVAIHERSEHA
jgi:hypothetical protein